MSDNDKQQKILELRRWAERCEREHRPAQALMVRNLAAECEAGAPWLEMMAEHKIEVPHDA